MILDSSLIGPSSIYTMLTRTVASIYFQDWVTGPRPEEPRTGVGDLGERAASLLPRELYL